MRYNFQNADWLLFGNFLEEKAISTTVSKLNSQNINDLNALIAEQI